MATINGTPADDTLTGTDTADTISAGDGNDTVNAGAGNDTINGGNGNDTINGDGGNDEIFGDDGNDTLNGGEGNDTIYSGLGADIIDGGNGDDRLFGGVEVYGRGGNDYIEMFSSNLNVIADGGSGNDVFSLALNQVGAFSSRFTVLGGEGDDTVAVANGGVGLNAPRNLINVGAGADRVAVLGDSSNDITLGAGADVVQIGFDRGTGVYASSGGYSVITDFVVGEDRLEFFFSIGQFRGSLSNWDGVTNPFASGHLLLVQRGTTASIELNERGRGATEGGRLLVQLANTQISSLTARELGGYAPDGSAPVGLTLTGTEGDDLATAPFISVTGRLVGGAGNDTINGLGGNDTIYGYAGSDTINGGAGNDTIYSGYGNDIVDGGEGNDYIQGAGGAARLNGGAGNDRIIMNLSVPALSIIDGGDGDDTLSAFVGTEQNAATPGANVQILGGAGSDTVFFGTQLTEVVTDLGTGNDIVQLFGANRALVTLGAGTDEIRLTSYREAGYAAGVRDFQVGVDSVSLPSDRFAVNGQPFFQNLAQGANPFSTGHARLAQWGNDTLLQFDRDGGGDNFFTAIIFSGVLPSAFTAADFRGMAPTSGFVYLSQPADLRLSGVSVNFNTNNPSVYQDAMRAIRDFEGYDLGGNGSWLRIGAADVNGDGDIDQILVNRAIGRFATVGTASDGLVYFSDHRWGGETRVAGIYIDPLVAAGIVQAGGPNDSQRRFQNDLFIENINRVLGANDYNRDGIHEVYFALTDGTAYLRALMHADGNIRYANYQSQQEVIDYLTANGFGPDTYAGWFTRPSDGIAGLGSAIGSDLGFAPLSEIALTGGPQALHALPQDTLVSEFA